MDSSLYWDGIISVIEEENQSKEIHDSFTYQNIYDKF